MLYANHHVTIKYYSVLNSILADSYSLSKLHLTE